MPSTNGKNWAPFGEVLPGHITGEIVEHSRERLVLLVLRQVQLLVLVLEEMMVATMEETSRLLLFQK